MTTYEDSIAGSGDARGQAPPPYRKAVLGAAIGNAVEWFDFACYGFLATTLAQVFFPSQDDTTAVLNTFAVFAAAFFVRPLGGLFFGRLGDRVGRRRTLSSVILLMSAATCGIGVLPSHEQAGMVATVLLVALRLLQGFSAGGELGGGAAFLAEYAPAKRRGFLVSWVEFTTVIGFLLGSLVVLGLTVVASEQQMVDWGWRIPFLIAAPLGIVGLFIRLRLEETPEFRSLAAEGKVARSPIREVLTQSRRSILVATILSALIHAGFYMLLVYLQTYATEEIGLSSGVASLSTTLSLLVGLIAIPFVGRLSDRVGRRPVMAVGAGALVTLTYPLFLLMNTGSASLAIAGQAGLGLLFAIYLPVSVCVLTELFPTRTRYGGLSIAYNIAAALFGGTAPYLATWLISVTGDPLSPAWYMIGVSAMALVASLTTAESARLPLSALHPEPIGVLGGDRASETMGQRV
ncbi:MAG TPA: MFS transporter [Nocardioidaceae bacterium]|nr:MFS transporter [Nocardioidaceae bacterium]